MISLRHNSDGFTHHLMFIAIIIGIITLISFAGRRVIITNTKAKTAKIAAAQNATATDASTGSTPTAVAKPTVITKKGSAAAVVTKTASTAATIPESIVVTSPYNLNTPEGSLNQLIKELKSKNFTNALYFISPRFMETSAALLKSQQYVTLDQCKANQTCNMLLNTPVEVLVASATSLYKSGAISSDGKTLTFNVALEGNTFVNHISSAGDYTLKVDMIDAGTNWVVDRISINGYTI